MDFPQSKTKSCQWSEPTWSYRPRLKAEFSRLLEPRMWRRVLVIVALLTIVLAWAIKRVIPDLEFNWFAALAKAAGILIFSLAAMFAVFWWLPPGIRIWSKGVTRQQGNAVEIRQRRNIRCITIDTAEAARPWLRIESAGRPLECGIAAKVSPAALALFLREQFPEISVVEKT